MTPGIKGGSVGGEKFFYFFLFAVNIKTGNI